MNESMATWEAPRRSIEYQIAAFLCGEGGYPGCNQRIASLRVVKHREAHRSGLGTPCASLAVAVGRSSREVGKRLERDLKKPHEYMATAFR